MSNRETGQRQITFDWAKIVSAFIVNQPAENNAPILLS